MHENFFKELFQNKTIKLQLLWSIISLFLKIENKTDYYIVHEKFEISRNKTWIENIPARNFKNDWKELLHIKKGPNGLEPTEL